MVSIPQIYYKWFSYDAMDALTHLVSKGKTLMDNFDFEDALSCFEQALLLEPANPELWNLKGTALRSIGRYQEALECFNKSLEIDPRDKFAS